MRAPRREVAAIVAVLALARVPAAEGEVLTDRLSGARLKAWKQIAAVVLATDEEGQPLPTRRSIGSGGR